MAAADDRCVSHTLQGNEENAAMETIDPGKGTEAGDGESPPAARPRQLLVIALVAGLAAGLLSWLGGEAVHGWFAPPDELLHGANIVRSPELARHQTIALIKNATLAFGLLGAVLGLVLGVAGGVAGRSPRAGALAAVIGLLAGAAAGAGLAQVLVPIAARDLVMVSESLVFALVIHGSIWSAVGAVGGLAFGLGLGGRRRGRDTALRAAAGGLVGAFLGTIVYDLTGAVIAPLAQTGAPLSETAATRLLARVAVCVLATLGAAWGAGAAPSSQPRPTDTSKS
jgi:hypothetical protein